MRWRLFVAFLCVVGAGACARAITDEPEAGGGDASVETAVPDASEDAAKDATGCPSGCPGGEVCSNGVCKSTCDAPLKQCTAEGGLVCADLTSDPGHCGQCTTACTTADAGGMAPGTNNPDPGIFDGGYDGGPGWSLGTAACKTSACEVDCPSAMTLCTDGICYDTQNHHDHCGACSTACAPSTEWCTQGHCCGVGSGWCGSACADLENDPNNCGACGNVCDGGDCSNGMCVACAPATIVGPGLTTNISGWPNAGLRLTALKTTTLTSFVVNNQGTADTVELTTTTGTVLQTLTLPASSTAYTANVSWSLTQGTSYDLILVGGANGRWVGYTAFPTSSTGIEVVSTVDQSQTLQSSYWFTFTNLTSCP